VTLETLRPGDEKTFPKAGDKLRMHYLGTLRTNGKKFDSSYDRNKPFEFRIGQGQVIRGWDEGVMKMSLGQKARLHITADYGYGAKGAGAQIPPNADLVFEVELLAIGNKEMGKAATPSVDPLSAYQTLKEKAKEEEDLAKADREDEEEDGEEDGARGIKRKIEALESKDELDEEDYDEILKMVDEAPEVKELDVAALKQLILKFEKAVSANVKQRVKYADQPSKFMESEVELDEAISALKQMASVPELYPAFVELKSMPTLLSLLAHENSDISIGVVTLLSDVMDAETLAEDPEATEPFVEAFLENKGLSVLVEHLSRLDESQSEDSQCVYNTMGIIESLIEGKGAIADRVCQETKLLPYVLKRMSVKENDANARYAAELLSIVLQAGSDKVKALVGEAEGVSYLVKVLARYRKNDPDNADEVEFVENLWNSLCFALTRTMDNQVRFAKAEGLELMLNMIRKKKKAKYGAIRALDFALLKCGPNCEKFVDKGGLKVLFAEYMTMGTKQKKKADARLVEEHVMSLICELFRHLSDVRYLRLFRKFQEHDYVKVDRLVELHERYMTSLEQAEREFKKDKAERKAEADAEELYDFKIDAGLFTLQCIDFVMGFVATAGDPKLRERMVQLLHQQDSSLDVVKGVLQEYFDHMEDIQTNDSLKQVLEAIIGML